MLGHGLCQHLRASGADVVATVHEHSLDVPGVKETRWSIGSGDTPGSLLARHDPTIIIYAAGLTRVDECETNEALADLLHAEAPAALAAAAASARRRFVYISTDHLWSGREPFAKEDQPVEPLNAYARSKAKGEVRVTQAAPSSLILRTNFFGAGRPWRLSLSDWMVRELSERRPFPAFSDAYFTPLAVPLLCGLICQSVSAGLTGTYHACGAERLSKYEFAIRLARWVGLAEDVIRRGSLTEAGLLAPRPADMSLSTEKLSRALGRPMPGIDESLRAVFGSRSS